MTSTWTRGALLCAAFFFSGCQGESVTSADLVARGGFVYTVNDGQPFAEAIAVRGKNIVFVGSDDEAAAYVGPETRVVELEGRMLMPGIIDAHVHPIGGSLKNLYQCNFPFSATPAEIQAKVGECVAQQPDAEWIIGGHRAHSSTRCPAMWLSTWSTTAATMAGLTLEPWIWPA